jgi:hypothetical protein
LFYFNSPKLPNFASPSSACPQLQTAMNLITSVENDIDAILKMGIKVLAGSLAQRGDKVRREPLASARPANAHFARARSRQAHRQ